MPVIRPSPTRTRRVLPYCVALLLPFLLPVQASAQQDSAEPIEEIVTTGSRISRDPNLAGALPVQSIDADEIQLSGEFSVSDIVNDVPALLSSVTSEGSQDNGAAFADGAQVLNLRGLGSNRTLTLVNGRRHVGGVQGSAAVDVGSIPMKLIERVEVLTGGASAIYGADAVTGVVNFITKDDYEGFGVDVNYGISSEGDGQQLALTGIWGMNFAGDRGNVAIALDWRTDEGLKVTDREGGEFVGSARDWVNPDLRFQIGDIDASATPNFAQYFNYFTTGLINYGLPIPSEADFIADYNAEFGVDPVLTDAERALIARAANAPQRAVLPGRTFPFTSGYGYIIPGNPFTFAGFDPLTPIDLDGNGTPDCLDSFTGYNSVFGAASFGVIGGCWNVEADGTYRPVRDGLVATGFQGFGGDSFNTIQNAQGDIVPPDDKIILNVLGSYELSPDTSLFGELKYVTQETDTGGLPNSFWDLLFGAPDNPYLPAFILPTAIATGGVAITVDPLHFDQFTATERDTVRGVAGIEGTFENSWTWEFSLNYGRYDQRIETSNAMINDRFFAAIDAVIDPGTGQPACRVDVDPNAPAQNTPFEIPAYEAGYFTFTPGAGQCVPLNIWAGRPGVTQEALEWVTVDNWSDLTIDQFVASAIFTGDSADWFELPAGPVQFAAGIEYRDESSDAKFDPWQRGVIPDGSILPAGSNINDVSENTSLVFRPQIATRDEKGSYDVVDVFVEASFPLLTDRPFARELSLDIAARVADYSTIGNTTTWKTNFLWAPVNSFALRGSVSEAVRAPNITELFGPEVGTTFRPADPCDAAQIQAIRDDDPGLAQNIQDNCVTAFGAIGLDPFDGNGNYVFADPLSASFGGVTGGNRELQEETAETFTAGFVFEPEFLEGFNLTLDYWDITIEDAIEVVTSQNIVDGCYQGASLNQNFCQLFTRNSNPNSAQFGGFNFLRSTSINFAKIETSGWDFSAQYAFEVGAHGFDVTLQGTKVEELNDFTNPTDLTEVNPELGEVNRPELAGNVYLNWYWGDLRVGTQSQFMDEQLVSFVEIETAQTLYGDAVFMDAFWQHDLNFRYQWDDNLTLYGGVRNVTDKDPFATDFAFPASPRGRFFFFGVDYQM